MCSYVLHEKIASGHVLRKPGTSVRLGFLLNSKDGRNVSVATIVSSITNSLAKLPQRTAWISYLSSPPFKRAAHAYLIVYLFHLLVFLVARFVMDHESLPPSTSILSRNFLLEQVTLPMYRVAFSREARIIFLEHLSTRKIFYLRCTDIEFLLLLELLLAPDTSISFARLSALGVYTKQRDRSSLWSHIHRIKRKLPSFLKIISEREEGYRLLVRQA